MKKDAAKKEKIQKIVLASLVACGGVYCYFDYLLAPLSAREVRAQAEIARIEPLIAKAMTQVKRTRLIANADPYAADAREVFGALERTIPREASVAWVPQRFGAFFKAQGIPRVSYRLTGEERDPEVVGYKLSRWGVSIPGVEFNAFAKALAAWENQEGLMQITHLNFNVSPGDVERQGVEIKLQTIVKP